MTLSAASIPRQPLASAGGPRRGRRIGPRIAASAIAHLALVLLVVLFATRRPPEPAPQAPSFQLMLAPGRPATQNLPPSLPAPTAPPEPQARPAPPPPAPSLPPVAVPAPAAPTTPSPPTPAPPAPPPRQTILPQAQTPAAASSRPVSPQFAPPQLVPSSPSSPSGVVREAAPPATLPPAVAPDVSVPPAPSTLATARPMATSVPAPAAPPIPRAALLPPAIPAPPPPGPSEAPPVRLALADPAADNLVPLPGPVPIPEPEPLPEPAPAPPPKRPAAAPSRMTITLADPLPDAPGSAAQESADDMIHVRGTDVPEAWKVKLHEWWQEHAYYPEEASRRSQQGTVTIHLRIDHDGHVRLVGLDSSSGSQWLDAGALAVFRGETVPALPPESPEPEKDFDLTIHYMLYRPR